MQIQFPRRVQLGFRPWYGLTIRQLAYLIIAGTTAGAIVLFGPLGGEALLMRALIGLGIISLGVALAFFRKDGLTAEQWIITRIGFWLKPQRRVWTRGGEERPFQEAEIQLDQPAAPRADAAEAEEAALPRVQLLHPTPVSPVSQAAIVFIDLAMLLALFTLVVYLSQGGWTEIQGWFMLQAGWR